MSDEEVLEQEREHARAESRLHNRKIRKMIFPPSRPRRKIIKVDIPEEKDDCLPQALYYIAPRCPPRQLPISKWKRFFLCLWGG